MHEKVVSDEQIKAAEKLLLPVGCHFDKEARAVIREWHPSEVVACPGSGKTTVLLAKLKILADMMPLQNGSGVCVLSHTNVAVDQIATKMPSYSGRLLGYPNFIGTIQSFVDRFLVAPFLKWRHGVTARPVDKVLYSRAFLSVMQTEDCRELTNYVRMRSKQSHGRQDMAAIIGEASLSPDGSLTMGSTTIAAAKPTAAQFAKVCRKLLEREGMVRYEDSYAYALRVLDEMPGNYVELLRKRFTYAFVDEYQDCSQIQREVLDRVFGRGACSYIRIGDPDQAIYSSYEGRGVDWIVGDEALRIGNSNRYGQSVANVLAPLRAHGLGINSSFGPGAKPVLIVYDSASIAKVPDAFAEQIVAHGIHEPDGTYKAVGFIRSDTTKGTSIGTYWDGFDASKPQRGGDTYWSMLDEACGALVEGRLYLAMPTLRRLIARILHYARITDGDTGKEITAAKVGRLLDDEMRLRIIELSKEPSKDVDSLDRWLRESLVKLDKPGTIADAYQCMPPHFMLRQSEHGDVAREKNVFVSAVHGVRIQFDTVHGVKGETHDATLYLETNYRNGTDIRRVLPHYGIGKKSNKPLYEYCRKIVYVGLSRPRKLLCLALSSETYEKGKGAFAEWEALDLR